MRVKQEMPDYDDSFDQDQSPASGSGQPMFPSAKVSQNRPPYSAPDSFVKLEDPQILLVWKIFKHK